jgi:hypothetical protein
MSVAFLDEINSRPTPRMGVAVFKDTSPKPAFVTYDYKTSLSDPSCNYHFLSTPWKHFVLRGTIFTGKHFGTLYDHVQDLAKYRVIHKSVKHFKNSQQINYASDHGNSYADRE